MIKKALVARVEKEWVRLLSIDEEEERECCSGSSPSGSCSSTGCSCRVTGRPMKASVPDNIRVAPGDTVEVTFSGLQAFTGFISIILTPAAAGLSLWFLTGQTGLSPNWQAGSCVIGICLMLAIVILLRSGKSSLPKITALLESGRKRP